VAFIKQLDWDKSCWTVKIKQKKWNCYCLHHKGIWRGATELQHHSSFTSTPDGDKWLNLHPSCFSPRNNPDICSIAGWVSPGAILNVLEKTKISCTCQDLNHGSSAPCLVTLQLHYSNFQKNKQHLTLNHRSKCRRNEFWYKISNIRDKNCETCQFSANPIDITKIRFRCSHFTHANLHWVYS